MGEKQPACWLGLCMWHSAFLGQHLLLQDLSQSLWCVCWCAYPLLWYGAAGDRSSCAGVPGKVWCLAGDGTVKNISNCTSSVQTYELDREGPLACTDTITSDNILKEAEGVEGTCEIFLEKCTQTLPPSFPPCILIFSSVLEYTETNRKQYFYKLESGAGFFSVTFTIRCYFDMLVAAGCSVTSGSYCLLINVEKKALQIVQKSLWGVGASLCSSLVWKVEEDMCSFLVFAKDEAHRVWTN